MAGHTAAPPAAVLTDLGLLLQGHRFLRSQAEDTELLARGGDAAAACRLAQRYDAQLNKNFALADLSRLPRLGLRWRTQAEVRSGKGETSCGALGCAAVEGLVAYELPFAYADAGAAGEERLALVKLLCCGLCAGRAFLAGAVEAE
jgi:protein FRA10AC1